MRSRLRVVGGSARGRKLGAPDGVEVRPTSDRVREATFNALGSLDEVVGRSYVDLFAGTGALGIEALSRGAIGCLFLDTSRRSIRAVEANVGECGFADRSEIREADATRFVRSTDRRFDVALADPPYEFDGWAELLPAVPAPLVVVESDRSVDPAGGTVLRERSYGGTVVAIIRFAGRGPLRPIVAEDIS